MIFKLLGACIAFITFWSSSVFAQKPGSIDRYKLQFTEQQWNSCGEMIHDQMKAAATEGQTMYVYWYDFSPIQNYDPSLDVQVSVPNTVDYMVVSTLDDGEPWRKFASGDQIDGWEDLLKDGEKDRFRLYDHLLGYLWNAKKAPGLMKGLNAAEKKLAIERSDIGMVEMDLPNPLTRKGMSTELIGAIRIYDATPSHYSSSPISPPELMYEARGMKAVGIDDIRRLHPDEALYIIGNWILPKETLSGVRVPMRSRLRAKFSLLKMLLEKIVKRSDDANYVVHVASNVIQRSYELDYGFKVIQQNPIEGSDQLESLMWADAKTLKHKLQKKIDELAILLLKGAKL